MKTQINLATKRIIQKRQLRKFFIAALVAFGGTVFLSAGILFVNFVTNLQISSLNEKKAEYEAEIARSRDTKDKILEIQERLSSIRTVMSERQDVAQRVNEVLALIPQSIIISSLGYSESTINIKIETQSLIDLQNFTEVKMEEYLAKNPSTVKGITIDGLNIDTENQKYQSSFVVEFAEKKSVPVKKEITVE